MAIPRVWGTTRCGSIVGASEVWGGGSCQLPAERALHFQLVHSGKMRKPRLACQPSPANAKQRILPGRLPLSPPASGPPLPSSATGVSTYLCSPHHTPSSP